MAWKVYGFMEPNGYSRDAGGEVYGPLPCKRWIRDIPHKRHKLHYRFHYSQRGADNADQYNESRAIAYARWLAARDGIDIPKTAQTQIEWSGFYSEIKTRATKAWDGNGRTTKNVPVFCKRIRAVEFGRKYKEEHYNTLKSGRRGAWTHNTHHVDVAARIEIPHWDFEPIEPVEERCA